MCERQNSIQGSEENPEGLKWRVLPSTYYEYQISDYCLTEIARIRETQDPGDNLKIIFLGLVNPTSNVPKEFGYIIEKIPGEEFDIINYGGEGHYLNEDYLNRVVII